MTDKCLYGLVARRGVWREARTEGNYAYGLEDAVVDCQQWRTEAPPRLCWDSEALCNHREQNDHHADQRKRTRFCQLLPLALPSVPDHIILP